MDQTALHIVDNYIRDHLDKSDPEVHFDVFMVWKAKILQNWKYLISSTLPDGMYYELTFNGDKQEWYLDEYIVYTADDLQKPVRGRYNIG